MFTIETIRTAPKILLHDHLDGGLRPATIIELAKKAGNKELPTYNEHELSNWMIDTANRNDLKLYLEAFAHTISVMQTKEAIYQVAAECAEDLTEDGVIYAEIRFAPELHLDGGLKVTKVIESALSGFRDGTRESDTTINVLICAIRSHSHSKEMMEFALQFRRRGVVGFDIAGPEIGYPPTNHLAAFKLARENNFPFTIHAGEVGGSEYIEEAINQCGAARIGHGLGIRDDLSVDGNGDLTMSDLALYIRDHQIALEMCPTSNLHIGAVQSIAEHPIDLFLKLGYCATINTDNRLMSATSLTDEINKCGLSFGWDLAMVHRLMKNALHSSFTASELREDLDAKLSDWYLDRPAMNGNDDALH